MLLQDLRSAVRRQLEVDELDLPNEQLDLYLREAFLRTIQIETAWPFYETEWQLTIPDGADSYPLPSDVNSVVSAKRVGYPTRLQYIAHETAEDSLPEGSGTPKYFSVWGNRIYLWPRQNFEIELSLRGWRKPNDWVSEGAGGEVDADERLHLPLVYYACSLYKAFEEDEVLEQSYGSRWGNAVQEARMSIMRPNHQRPLVLHGGLRGATGRLPHVWNAP